MYKLAQRNTFFSEVMKMDLAPFAIKLFICQAVMAQWIRLWTLNCEVSSSDLAAAVVPLGKALSPHCLVPQKGLKDVGPMVACI